MISQVKLWTGVVAVTLLALAGWKVNSWRADAALKDKAIADLAAYGAAVEAREKEAAEERARAKVRSEALSATLTAVESELAELRQNPIIRTVTREKIVNGVSCPVTTLGPDFGKLWNDQADAASSALLVAD